MAILTLEGLDDNLWSERLGGTLTSSGISASYGLHGNGVRVGDTPNEYFTLAVPSTARFVLGCAFKVAANAVSDAEMLIFDSATTVRFDSNRLHLNSLGSATADIDWYSGVGSIAIGDWHYLEVELEHGSLSDGVIKWWLDGTLLDSTTTHDFASVLDASVQFAGVTATNVDDVYFDDIYVCDNTGGVNDTALGPIEIVDLYPDGNGNSSALVGSDSNSTDNYLLVDNNATAPPATAEYVGSGTEGDKDTYTMDDLSGTPTVVGVVVSLYGIKTDSGVKYIRPVVRSGTTDYNGDTEGLAESYSLHEHTWDKDPDTAATWLYGDVNSMEVGQEVRDS